ncbi:hypothetical protein ACFUIW_18595 [Streptomyces sp. NPDC057245]|uniref:hypothetical protein n=1 Tax=Streptomyces TaxID=1883 RepID=UPI001C1DF834|nr:hypothetical protein [Streptomyces sp. A108]MBU6534488.1 hypothetical protein [Streptomyces sp. A108]
MTNGYGGYGGCPGIGGDGGIGGGGGACGEGGRGRPGGRRRARPDRRRGLRGTWTVVCVAAAVVLGPAAVTASALGEANAAPPHHAVTADRPEAYLPSDTGRRRTA